MFVPYILLLFEKQNQVLLLRRSNSAVFGAGMLSIPGGKIEHNESARQAAVREAYEELGVQVHVDDLEFVHLLDRQGETEQLFVVVFRAKKWLGELSNKEPEKHSEMGWFSKDTLPDDLLSAHVQVIQKIHEKVLYSEHGF